MDKHLETMKNPNLLSTTSPSQYLNIGWLLLSIGGLFVHPIIGGFFFLLLIWSVLDVLFWEYQFYNDRVIEKRGILNVTEESVNYFRIKSIKIERPLWMRFFGLSVISVTTSEQFKPFIKFYAVADGHTYVEYLQNKAKSKRKENGIRDIDVFHSF
jgi:uncharacterized membrane protein YdbT with pleckstrin-like domain